MTIRHTIPQLTGEDLTGPVAPGATPTGGQTTVLPHLYQRVTDRVVRYRISLDTSYLVQSSAIADVWTQAGWVELAQIRVDKEFYIISGPDQAATNPSVPELTRGQSIGKRQPAEYVAQSFQKVVNRLAQEAEMVLDAVDGSDVF